MKIKTIRFAAIAALLILLHGFIYLLSGASANADVAASPRPSDVLADLQKDTSFNAADYPAIADDYTLNVFQITESTDSELLIYVYQPSGNGADLRATTVRISQGINDNAKWQDYGLTILSSNGVFYKYKVNGIEIKSDTVRYYDIAAIHRHVYYFDEPTDNDNEINEVVYEVGQLWTVCTLDGNVSYTCENVETINVESKYVGRIRYSNGFKLYSSACDSWLIAFSTDRKIDNLFEADVTYYSQRYHTTTTLGFISSTSYEDKVYHPRETVRYDDTGGNDGGGLGGVKYQWNRIERVDDFLKEDNVDENYKKNFVNKTWVLRFVETPFTKLFAPYGGSGEEGTEISEVSILRLKFETDGKIYNLGVVDNKQTGTTILNQGGGVPWWVWVIIAAVIIVILCIISKTFRKVVGFIIKVVTSPLWFPFWLISESRKRKRQRLAKRQERERQREGKRQAKAERRRQRKERAANVKAKITSKFKRKPKQSSKPAEPTTPATTAPDVPARVETPTKIDESKERAKGNEKRKPRNGKKKKNPPRGNR